MIAIPIIFITILTVALAKNIDIFNEFIKGVKNGTDTTISIFPSLLGLMVAIGIFRDSGALDFIISFLEPMAKILKIPQEILPLVLLRPISGSASLAMATNILKTHGVDSLIGKTTAVMMGSTETILYTISIYLGSIKIKKIKYTLLVTLIAELFSICVAVRCCQYVFK